MEKSLSSRPLKGIKLIGWAAYIVGHTLETATQEDSFLRDTLKLLPALKVSEEPTKNSSELDAGSESVMIIPQAQTFWDSSPFSSLNGLWSNICLLLRSRYLLSAITSPALTLSALYLGKYVFVRNKVAQGMSITIGT